MYGGADVLAAYKKARRTKYVRDEYGRIKNDDDGAFVLETYVASREYNFVRSKGPMVSGVFDDVGSPSSAEAIFDEVSRMYRLNNDAGAIESSSSDYSSDEEDMTIVSNSYADLSVCKGMPWSWHFNSHFYFR